MDGKPASRLRSEVEDLEAQLLADLHRGSQRLLSEQERLVRRFSQQLLTAQTRVAAVGRSGSELKEQENGSDDGTPGAGEIKPVPMARKPSSASEFRRSGSTSPRDPTVDLGATDYLHHTDEDIPTYFTRLSRVYNWWMTLAEPERTGRLARIVLNPRFETFTLVMIMLNGALVIYQTNEAALIARKDPTRMQELKQWEHWDVFAEHIFAVFFIVELLLRVTVHRFYFFCNSDMWWNIFDAVTVAAAVVDIGMGLVGTAGESMDIAFLRVIRLFRMTRSLRIFRALHFITKLRQLMDCILSSFAGLFWCILLLVFFTGIFATFLVQCATAFWSEAKALSDMEMVMSGELETAFGSIPTAMISLFQATSGGNDWGYYYEIMKVTGLLGPFLLVMYILFFIIAAWNIVTSLFIEKALALAQPDQDQQMLKMKRQDLLDARTLLQLIEGLDDDHSGTLTIGEFKKLMTDAAIQKFFAFKGIDIKDAELFFHMLEAAAKATEIRTETVTNGLMRMRGYATNLDLQAVIFQISMLSHETGRLLHELHALQKDVRTLSVPSRELTPEHVECLPGETPLDPVAEKQTPNRRVSMAMQSVQLDIAAFGLSPSGSPVSPRSPRMTSC